MQITFINERLFDHEGWDHNERTVFDYNLANKYRAARSERNSLKCSWGKQRAALDNIGGSFCASELTFWRDVFA